MLEFFHEQVRLANMTATSGWTMICFPCITQPRIFSEQYLFALQPDGFTSLVITTKGCSREQPRERGSLLDSTLHYHWYTSFYVTLHYSIMALLDSTWLYVTLRYSTMALLHSTRLYCLVVKSCEEFLKQLLKETHPPHHPAVMKELSCLHRMRSKEKLVLIYHDKNIFNTHERRRCCCTNHTAKDEGLWHYGEWFCWCTLQLSATFWCRTWSCKSNRSKFSKNC